MSSFFNSYDTESYAEGYEVIHFPNANDTSSNFHNHHHHQLQQQQQQSAMKNSELNSNIYVQSGGMMASHNINSFLNSSIVQIVEVGDFPNGKKGELLFAVDDILKPTTNSFYFNSDNLFTDSNSNNLLKYLPNKHEMQELNNNNIKMNGDTLNDDPKKVNRKRSMPNLTFNEKRDLSQFSTPYLTKGKLCGHFKVR